MSDFSLSFVVCAPAKGGILHTMYCACAMRCAGDREHKENITILFSNFVHITRNKVKPGNTQTFVVFTPENSMKTKPGSVLVSFFSDFISNKIETRGPSRLVLVSLASLRSRFIMKSWTLTCLSLVVHGEPDSSLLTGLSVRCSGFWFTSILLLWSCGVSRLFELRLRWTEPSLSPALHGNRY